MPFVKRRDLSQLRCARIPLHMPPQFAQPRRQVREGLLGIAHGRHPCGWRVPRRILDLWDWRLPRKAADAISLLTNDHKEVKQLFKTYEKLVDDEADEEQRAMLAVQICTMLTVHATIEEEIFYPAARKALREDEDLLDEAQVEHASAKDLIAQILAMNAGEALYDAKVKVLGEYITTSRKSRKRSSRNSGKRGSISPPSAKNSASARRR